MNNFDTCIGKTYKFYGVDTDSFKLDETIWFVEEWERDGTSGLSFLQPLTNWNRLFFSRPLATVVVAQATMRRMVEHHPGTYYQLIDVEDGHVWLEFGTDCRDSCYPLFVFEYQPKNPGEEKPLEKKLEEQGTLSLEEVKKLTQDYLYTALYLASEVSDKDLVEVVVEVFDSMFERELKWLGFRMRDEILLRFYQETKRKEVLHALSKEALVEMALKAQSEG